MKIRTEADFDVLVRGAKLVSVAAAWTELGLWDELARRQEPVDLGELPGDRRALEITAPILAHAGLLDGDGRLWAMSARAREMHERGELPTGRNLQWMEDLSRMAVVLREGGPVRDATGKPRVTSGGVVPDDREATRRFLDMLYRRSAGSAREVADWLAPRLPEGAHFVDVGGGHGRYAAEMVERGYTATLFDQPLVIELARERHGDGLGYREGDFHRDDLGGPYDAAFLSNVVHGESETDNARLVERLHGALRPGGWIVIKDMFLDELGREPENAVFFGATVLFYTALGRSYTIAEVDAWCRQAGLNPAETIAVAEYTLVLARKP
ncbi:MAG: methyltransferase domain-containing protein [Gammaproteobacteria bacterium]|nr:methyltransferase domain-containing protein [Gammaproteobacteria bacterium]NIR83762.1 methyltransferase domain-containing protein [Gammaproteobacteria bacterium]NIR88120.1 methyltransferase domain-containing protein [Gammaproteobacteria bacterium]NIU05079.1 methyltransferase domain-containing protein [Gammaproteobacteria bacterium]NIV51922.1 methyltransferase domain-containing protein [Gammaproteobacteria bacterium]